MLSIAYIGEVVHACLSSHDQGVVESVFERSAYILFDDRYLCIALSSVGRGPLNILYSPKVQALHCQLRPAAAVRFCLADQTLRVNEIVVAQLAQARICDSTVKSIQPVAVTLSAHRRSLVRISMPSTGLFSLVAASTSAELANSTLSSINSRLHTDSTVDLALKQFALPILRNLINWLQASMCIDAAVLEPHRNICRLLGAGPGLTPSGDDLLAGVLLALQLTGYTCVSEMLWAHLQPEVANRTNRISATLLQQAAQGRAGEFALAALAMYVARGNLDTGELSDVLAHIGETSGWDFFAGVVLVLDVVGATTAESADSADRQLVSS